jgi:hypothetical protein
MMQEKELAGRSEKMKKTWKKQFHPGHRVRNRRLHGRNALPLLIYPAEKKRMRKIQVTVITLC